MVASVAEAREHISRIRESRGLDVDGGNNMNAQDLHAALAMLSEQLYQRPTRFIMELIQNADDNQYKDQLPELSLTLSGRTLHICCNETGFTEENIEAICRIHKSTKTNDTSGEGYVGEKGIGFKSVFKVADIVWISSGHYSFKFDKRTTLGMVTPIWESFPVATRPGFTQFYLELSQDTDVDGIKKELVALQPSLLLFLRRLRKINITVPDQPLISLSCVPSLAGRKVSRNGDTNEYVVHEHTVTDMPEEERRPGIKSTRLLLAFPMDKNNEPILKDQDVFAFLPIRSYGLKFLIQADFLLVASREDIDQSRAWNTRLLDGIVDAFMDAISPPHHPYLELQWPRYAPRHIHPGTFLKRLEHHIGHKIRRRDVILSSEGSFEKPAAVRYIPSKFLYKAREPMFSYSQAFYKPLSFRYPDAAVDDLLVLGVGKERTEHFIKQLNVLVQSRSHDFRHLGPEWHARLATILCNEGGGSTYPKLRNIDMITLRNGAWVASQGNTIFFDKNQSDLTIPDGLDVLTVDPAASANASRRQLFASLGVQECNDVEIGKTIIKRHEKLDNTAINVAAMVQQTRFLYSTRVNLQLSGQPISEGDVWFANTKGAVVRGGGVYLEDGNVCALEDFFPSDLASVSLLHPAYTEGLVDNDFRDWLRQTFNVSSIPRLSTPEFEHMMTSCDPTHVLKLLVDHWSTYSPLMVDSVLAKLKSMKARCQDGSRQPLHQTYLPLEALTTKTPVPNAVPFLDLPDPTNPQWEILEKLGVRTVDNLGFYLDCLRGYRQHVGKSPQLATIQQLYQEIEERCLYDDAELVRSRFAAEPLIYLPPTSGSQAGRWHMLAQCIWAAPNCLRGVSPLQSAYPARKKLFKDMLGSRDAGTEDAIKELVRVHAGLYGSDYAKTLLTLLSHYIERGCDSTSLSRLKDAAIFPIRCGIPVSLLSARAENWFIADYPYLSTEFQGKLDLLDMAPEQCRRLSLLFEALGVQGKYLSEAVKQRLQCRGDAVPSLRFAQLLQSKAVFLAQLSPKMDRERVLEQLLHAEVYEVTAIDVERYVEIPGKDGPVPVHGRPSHGDVVVDMVKNSAGQHVPHMYIAAEALNPDVFPPYQLCKELCRLCNIKDKLQGFVGPILRMSDSQRIQSLLDAEKIDVVRDDADGIEENEDGLNIELEDDRVAEINGVQARSPEQCEQDRRIGFEGEKHVFEMLQRFDESLDMSIWTSSVRERGGHPPFTGEDKEYADFTVPSTGTKLASYLLGHDSVAAPAAGLVTYHIEVKSAAGPLTSDFFMSHAQMQKARQCTLRTDGSHVYLIARVYDIKSGAPQHRFYADPWRLWFEGNWEIKPLRGPYVVSAKV